MAFINLTPHTVHIYQEDQFLNLQQTNPTTWVADGVEGSPLLELPSQGSVRISTSTVELDSVDGISMYETVYGEVTGVPDGLDEDDILVVSLPSLQAMKGQKYHVVSPYKVVRSRENGSVVYGAMGFTY